MPVMDGFAATRAIRAQARHAGLPILAMTANAMSGDRELCLASGMNDHIGKPIDMQQLFTTLARWVTPRTPVAAQGTATVPVPEHAAEPAVSTTSRQADPLSVEGLNLAQALQRLGGNTQLLRKLMGQFAQQQESTATRMAQALRAQDFPAVAAEAHTLKGLAGNIGAGALQEAARQLEDGLSPPGSSPALPGLLERFETELQSVIRTLETRLPAGSTDPAPQPLAADPHRLEAACRRIAQLLAASDCEVSTELQANQSLLRQGLGQDLDAIAQATEDFDFESALQQLRTAALAHGIALEEQRA